MDDSTLTPTIRSYARFVLFRPSLNCLSLCSLRFPKLPKPAAASTSVTPPASPPSLGTRRPSRRTARFHSRLEMNVSVDEGHDVKRLSQQRRLPQASALSTGTRVPSSAHDGVLAFDGVRGLQTHPVAFSEGRTSRTSPALVIAAILYVGFDCPCANCSTSIDAHRFGNPLTWRRQ